MRSQTHQSLSRGLAAAVLAVAAMTGVSACSSDAPASSSTSPASSSTSPAAGQHVAAKDFATAMKQPGTIVLDVRTPAEFAEGHLPQAKNIDFESADFATKIAALDKSAAYAVYCRSGNRSGSALEQMRDAGFTHAYDLDGGIVAWQDMGGPITTS